MTEDRKPSSPWHYLWKIPLAVTILAIGCLAMAVVGLVEWAKERRTS